MLGFNIEKTIQAAAHLIKRMPEQADNYMRLLKLLYVAERTSLAERGMPITGDTPYAMRRGPVLSVTFYLIKGEDPDSPKWEQYIQKNRYLVYLKSDPGNLQLSRAELSILDRVAYQFENYDEWAMVHWCHKHIPEYQKNWRARGNKKRRRIPLQDVLEAVGRPDVRSAMIERANANAYFGKLFGDHMPAAKQG